MTIPTTKVVKLEQNYRSTTTILDAANALVSHNRGRKPKKLWSDRGVGEPIAVFECRDEHEEARLVCEEMVKLLRERPASDLAVFYRVNAQSRVLEDMLVRQGVAYRVVGGTKFYQRAEIKDLLAYLRVVVNATDDLSLLRVINTPRRGLGDVAIGRLQNFAAENSVSLREALLCAADVPGFAGAAANACVRLGEGFADWAAAAGAEEASGAAGATGAEPEPEAESPAEAAASVAPDLLKAAGSATKVAVIAGRVLRGERPGGCLQGREDHGSRGPPGEPGRVRRSGPGVRPHEPRRHPERLPAGDQPLRRPRQPGRGPSDGHPDDAAQRQGPGVPGGVHHRSGRRAVPALALARRAAPGGGAAPLLRGHHPGPRQAVPLPRALPHSSRGSGLQDPQPLPGRDPQAVGGVSGDVGLSARHPPPRRVLGRVSREERGLVFAPVRGIGSRAGAAARETAAGPGGGRSGDRRQSPARQVRGGRGAGHGAGRNRPRVLRRPGGAEAPAAGVRAAAEVVGGGSLVIRPSHNTSDHEGASMLLRSRQSCMCVVLAALAMLLFGCAKPDATTTTSGVSIENSWNAWSTAEPWSGQPLKAPVLFPARQDAKWGYIDKTGRVVVDFSFDEAREITEGLAAVKVGSLYGYIDETGAMVIDAQWYRVGPFNGGLAAVYTRNTAVTTEVADTVSYVDRAGQLVIPADPEWADGAQFSEGLAAVWFLKGGCGYIDTKGALVIALPEATAAFQFSEGLAAVCDGSDRWGYIDRNGQFVIKPQFRDATEFSNGFAVVEFGNERQDYEIIDQKGRVVRQLEYDYVMGLNEGRAAVLKGGGFAAMAEGQDILTAEWAWGYVDEAGTLLIPTQFKMALDYTGGLALVTDENERMGYIDLDGNYVWRER